MTTHINGEKRQDASTEQMLFDPYEVVAFLSGRYTTGLVVPGLGLPVEEALFFLLTNLFVVQGLVLWEWVVRRWA